MDDKVRKILERPFPTQAIKQRKGPNGKTLSYVEVQDYIDKLNEAFAGDWSIETECREQVEDQVIVEMKLTAGGVVKTGLGGAAVARRRDDGRLVSLADDYKKAEAEAVKRCCRLLGIGASLYNGEAASMEEGEAAQHRPFQPAIVRPVKQEERQANVPVPQAPYAEQERTRLTNKQMGAILAVARSRGMSQQALRNYVRVAFGVVPEFLTKAQASELIGSLGTPSNGGNGHDATYATQVQRQPGED